MPHLGAKNLLGWRGCHQSRTGGSHRSRYEQKAAKQIAQTVATSNLVKTALFGGDANWGRVMAALGRAGVPIDPSRISLKFGGIPMVRKGQGLGRAAERALTKVFKAKEFTILIDLAQGKAGAYMWTTDLSLRIYVRINASYRS